MKFLIDFLLTIHIIVSLLLVLVVLLQRPRSEGLGTAFASGMVETFIGPATSFLVRFTTWMAGAFFFLTIALAVLYSHQNSGNSMIAAKMRAAAAAKPNPAPTPAARPTSVLPVPSDVPAATVAAAPTPAAAVAPSPEAPAAPVLLTAPSPGGTSAPEVTTATAAPVTVPNTVPTDAAAPTPVTTPISTPAAATPAP